LRLLDSLQFDVAVVHDKVLCHESFELVAVDYIKLAMRLEATHQARYTALKSFPVFLVASNLSLAF
jgi:hypothetical protein